MTMKRKRVLIVEDEPDIREIFSTLKADLRNKNMKQVGGEPARIVSIANEIASGNLDLVSEDPRRQYIST